MCQDELVEDGCWLVDTFAVARGDRPVDAPTHDEYMLRVLSRASGLRRPETVLTLMLYEGPRLVIGEIKPRRTERRESLFLGLCVAEDGDLATWFYVWTGLGGLLGLCHREKRISLRDVIVYEGAVMPVEENLRTGQTTVREPVLVSTVEGKLPGGGFMLLENERVTLKEFVDRRINEMQTP
jgi:hypothetical protein